MDTDKKSNQHDSLKNQIPTEVKSMSNKVNLLDIVEDEPNESQLEVVRLGNNETAIIPFTADSESVDVHYCQETEINSYVTCNGPDCVLCRIGRKKNQRLLLPVYLPASECIGILPVTRSLRPNALLPQVLNVLKVENPMVMFVTREGIKYSVSTAELPNDVDAGEILIKQFREDYEAGNHDLSIIYPKIDNEQLANVEEINRMMTLKGVSLDDGN